MSDSTLVAANAPQWVECEGSVEMQTLHGFHSTDRDEMKEEGKACHFISSEILKAYKGVDLPIVTRASLVGTVAPNDILITDELFDLSHEYAIDVLNYCNESGALQNLHIEERVELDHILHGMYGSVDCYSYESGKLTVWEAGFGYGVIEVFENWRLIQSASGILETLDLNGLDRQHIIVTLKVVQPRAFHKDGTVREWTITASDLRPFVNRLHGQAHAAFNGGAECKAGLQCKKCTARHSCETLQRNVFEDVDYVGKPVNTSLTGSNLAYELKLLRRASKLIEARLTGIEAQAESEIKSSAGSVPGFGLVQGHGRKTWKKDTDIDEVIMMGDLMGCDLRKPNNLVTPSQAINKGVDEAVINAYSYKPKTKIKLVEDNGSKARQAFK